METNTDLVKTQTYLSREVSFGHNPRGVNALLAKDEDHFTLSVNKLIEIGEQVNEGSIETLRYIVETIKQSKSFKMPINSTRLLIHFLQKMAENKNDAYWTRFYRNEIDKILRYRNTPRKIHELLRRHGLIETTDNNDDFRDKIITFDRRMHDSFTTGTQSTLNLLLDAYARGIQDLSISYVYQIDIQWIDVGLKVAEILGLKVAFSLEFSEGKANDKAYYLIYLPRYKAVDEYKKLIESQTFKTLCESIANARKLRVQTMKKQLEYFNKIFLPEINKDYIDQKDLQLPPLSFFQAYKHESGLPTRTQLSQQLAGELAPLYKRRIQFWQQIIKNRENMVIGHISPPKFLADVKKQLKNVKSNLNNLDPFKLRKVYFSREAFDHDCEIPDLKELFRLLRESGCRIVLGQPTEIGINKMFQVIGDNLPYVTGVEVYNARHSHNRDAYITATIHKIIHSINNAGKNDATDFKVKAAELVALTEKLKEFKDFRLSIFYGSNSTAHEAIRPGFYTPKDAEALNPKLNKRNLRLITTNGVSRLHRIIHREPDTKIYHRFSYKKNKRELFNLPAHTIHTLAFLKEFTNRGFHRKFFQLLENPHPFFRAIKSLYFWIKAPTPWIRNSLIAIAGMLPAVIFPNVTFGHVILFYSITLTRNILVDQISHSQGFKPFSYNFGSRQFEWKWKPGYIDWANTTNSLFWTGCSIIMLQEIEFGVGRVIDQGESLHLILAKGAFFMTMSIANFFYIFTHTYFIRGIEFAIAFNSAMRSIYSVPFSTLTGALFFPEHADLFIQNKAWTDTTAGFIEGFGKMRNLRGERIFDFTSLLDDTIKADKKNDEEKIKESVLNIIHIFATQPRGKETLSNLLFFPKKYEQLVAKRKLKAYQNFAQKLNSYATPELLSTLEKKPLDKEVTKRLYIILEREIMLFRTFLSKNLSKAEPQLP